MPEHDEAQMLQEARLQRLEILNALVVAIERRAEVMELIAGSASADAAQERIAELLGISQIAATAILDIQARRFAQSEANRIKQERDRLLSEVE